MSVARSPSLLRIAARFFRPAAICSSMAARMSREGSIPWISTRVMATPHVDVTAFRSLRRVLLIRSRDEKDSSRVSFPTFSRSCVRHRLSIASRTSWTLYLAATVSWIRR